MTNLIYMKKIIILLAFVGLISIVSAQKIHKSAKEFRLFTSVISFSDVSINGTALRTVPRFNLSASNRYHYGWGAFGFFAGWTGNNWGIIVKDDSTTLKRRVLTLGPEVGIRFGFPKASISLGTQVDFPFAYKQKTFVNGTKKKDEKWFNLGPVNSFLPSAFIGLAFKFLDLKLSYMFGNFYKTIESDIPQLNRKANIYAISLGINQLYLKEIAKGFGTKKHNNTPKTDTKEEEKSNVIKTSYKTSNLIQH